MIDEAWGNLFNAVGAMFAVTAALGGTYLVAGVSSEQRPFIGILLVLALLAFALAALDTVPPGWDAPMLALAGVASVSLTLIVAWFRPAGPAAAAGSARPTGFVEIDNGHGRICGVVTAQDHDFIEVTEHIASTNVPQWIPIASIVSIWRSNGC